jgi:hypothetical protein
MRADDLKRVFDVAISKDRLHPDEIVRVSDIVDSAEHLSVGRFFRQIIAFTLFASFALLFLHSWPGLGFVLPDEAVTTFCVSIPMALVGAFVDYVRDLRRARRRDRK